MQNKHSARLARMQQEQKIILERLQSLQDVEETSLPRTTILTSSLFLKKRVQERVYNSLNDCRQEAM